jgi:hypothetical protein
MAAHLESQIRPLCVANFGNSRAITCNLRLDGTDLGFQSATTRINRGALKNAFNPFKRIFFLPMELFFMDIDVEHGFTSVNAYSDDRFSLYY